MVTEYLDDCLFQISGPLSEIADFLPDRSKCLSRVSTESQLRRCRKGLHTWLGYPHASLLCSAMVVGYGWMVVGLAGGFGFWFLVGWVRVWDDGSGSGIYDYVL